MNKRNMWRNLPLSIKIFLSYSVLLVVSCSVFAVSVYVQMSQAANNRILDSLRTMTGQSAYELNTILENMETQARLFAENDVVRTQTMLIYTDGYEDPVERYNGYRSMEQMIFSFSDHPDLHSVSLAFAESSLFFRDQIHYFVDDGTLFGAQLLRSGSDDLGGYLPVPQEGDGGEGDLTYIRRIVNPNLWSEEYALACFTVSSETIRRRISTFSGDWPEEVYLLDWDGNVRCSSVHAAADPQGLLTPEQLSEMRRNSTGSFPQQDGWHHIYSRVGNTPFYLLVHASARISDEENLQIVTNCILIAVLVFAASSALSFFLSHSITSRLAAFSRVMGQTSDPLHYTEVEVDSRDEIGQMKSGFNSMLRRMQALIRDNMQIQLDRKETELYLLQTQINPHFLYNTLNCIGLLAAENGQQNIAYLIKNLSSFLHIGLNSGNRMSTIAKELEHTVSYFNIQQFRYPDRFRMTVDVPEELHAIPIISMVLQPLVENAILHGIIDSGVTGGEISISGCAEEGIVLLTVSDNGKGIEPGRLAEIQRVLTENENASEFFGLCNVNRRIKLHYGEEYGLSLESTVREGTCCLLTFPDSSTPPSAF